MTNPELDPAATVTVTINLRTLHEARIEADYKLQGVVRRLGNIEAHQDYTKNWQTQRAEIIAMHHQTIAYMTNVIADIDAAIAGKVYVARDERRAAEITMPDITDPVLAPYEHPFQAEHLSAEDISE